MEEEAREPVFVNIACGHANRPAAKFESNLLGNLLERTVALIAEKLNWRAVIYHQKIDVALIVEIGRDDRRGLVLPSPQAGLRGDVGETSVAVVAIESVLFAY